MCSGISILLFSKVLVLFLCLPIYSLTTSDMAETAVLKGNSDFTKNLYKILSRGEGNVFFSPISIHAILSLASQGAGGATKDALTSALNVPDVKVAAEGYKAIMSRLNSIAEITLHMANKVFLKENYKLQETFKSIVTSHFLSEVDLVNFVENTKAAKTINSWVEQKTNNKIKDLIDSNDLDADTRLVLVNAIYFKGKWAEPFNPSHTKTEKFYLDGTDHNTVDVQMMHLKKKFYFKVDETLDAKILELPYTNKDISMLIILPNAKDGIARLEEKLAQTDLTKITEDMHRPEVMVSLPKFKIEQTIDLKDSLTELGLGNMFSRDADFSGMLDSPEQLCVSKVIQKAFIEVNEEGAEAAAATGMIWRFTSAHISPPSQFLADHPFLVILYTAATREKLELGSSSILFKGRVLQPQL